MNLEYDRGEMYALHKLYARNIRTESLSQVRGLATRRHITNRPRLGRRNLRSSRDFGVLSFLGYFVS